MTALLIYLTVLTAMATILATRIYYLTQAYFVSREIAGRTVNHTCDEPDTCPADFVIAEMKANTTRARNELGVTILALVFALIGWGSIFAAIAGR